MVDDKLGQAIEATVLAWTETLPGAYMTSEQRHDLAVAVADSIRTDTSFADLKTEADGLAEWISLLIPVPDLPNLPLLEQVMWLQGNRQVISERAAATYTAYAAWKKAHRRMATP